MTEVYASGKHELSCKPTSEWLGNQILLSPDTQVLLEEKEEVSSCLRGKFYKNLVLLANRPLGVVIALTVAHHSFEGNSQS